MIVEKRLAEISDVIMGQSPDGIHYNTEGDGWPLITGAGQFGELYPEPTQFSSVASRLSKVGDIILCIRATIGDLNWADKEYVVGRGVAAIRPKPEVNSRYLWHFLKTQKNTLSRYATGSTFKQIKSADVKELIVPLPPLEEQRRIAEVLDKADALRQKRRLALQKLDTLLQSVFLEIFGDPVRNPKGWPTVPFDEVCKTRLGKMLDQKKYTGKDLRPYLRNANVQWNRFDLTDVDQMDFDEREREILRLKYGDLLICEGGEVGRTAIWRNELPECYYQKALHKGSPDTTRTTSEYLMFLLWFFSKNGGFKDYVTSVTIAHLTGEKLKTIKIPMPPVEAQQRFSDIVKIHSRIRDKYVGLAASADGLFYSAQNRAFKGELFKSPMPSVGFEPKALVTEGDMSVART